MSELSIKETFMKHRELLIEAQEIEEALIKRIEKITSRRDLLRHFKIERIQASCAGEATVFFDGRDYDNYPDSAYLTWDQLSQSEEDWVREQEIAYKKAQEEYVARKKAEIEAYERSELVRLQAKYPDAH